MDGPLVSVITPVYNVEQYIEEYLCSILNQTYENLEIICVDDGSPDRCGDILEEYSSRDSRLKVIHQKNAGASGAYNSGLDNATGDFIGFCDPDDWIELDYYEKAINLAKRTNADIVITSFFREYADRSEIMENTKPIPELFEDKEAAICYGFEADVYRGFKMYLWNKLFRSSFFTSENNGLGLKLDTSMSTGADSLLSAKCFLNANRFAYTPDAFYHYRIREASLMRNSDFSRRLGFNDALEQIAGMLEQEQFGESTISLIKRFHTYYCSQLAEFAHFAGDSQNLDYSKNLMMKYLNEYIEASTQHPERIARINRILNLELEV